MLSNNIDPISFQFAYHVSCKIYRFRLINTMDCIVVNVVAPNQFWVIKKDQDDSAVKQVEILIKEAVQSGLLTLASAGDKKVHFNKN